MEKRIFMFDELSTQKQENVREAYARPNLGEIGFVIDDTAFGGCRDGLILTENFIATKEMFQEPNYHPLECLESIECINKKLILNRKIIYKFTLVEQNELDAFVAFINDALQEKKVITNDNDVSVEQNDDNDKEEAADMAITATQSMEGIQLFGQVFVQSPSYEIGRSSYHFDAPDNIYINFEKWKKPGILTELPIKKNFTNVKFFPDERVFIGLIDWTAEGGCPFTSSTDICWLYLLVFNEDYSKITHGHVVDNGSERVNSFSNDLNYVNFSLAPDKAPPQVDVPKTTLCRQAAEQGNAEAQYQLGLMLFSDEDYNRAAAWFRKAAEQEHAVAQRALGIMYFQGGFGVPSSFSKAAAWFYKAAKQGDATAQYYLGIMFENGYDVPQDDAKATAWYRKAAEQGHPEALEKLGV